MDAIVDHITQMEHRLLLLDRIMQDLETELKV